MKFFLEGIKVMEEVKKEEEIKKEEDEKKEVNYEELLSQKEQELKKWKERALRYAAEVENLKKSFKREKEEYYKFALETVFKELLPSIDNLERAIEAFKESLLNIFVEEEDVKLHE